MGLGLGRLAIRRDKDTFLVKALAAHVAHSVCYFPHDGNIDEVSIALPAPVMLTAQVMEKRMRWDRASL